MSPLLDRLTWGSWLPFVFVRVATRTVDRVEDLYSNTTYLGATVDVFGEWVRPPVPLGGAP